ncbi:MAG: transglycosylase SLT domain-containing protein, partial [Bacteroidaceae bacterium]|nr:transglycosylase SLT domain-containing protein [Bacteroidaceae bacterium]
YHPEENVKGAVKYLQMINTNFSDIPSQEERIKFMLAAYNCGVMHVKDAQALAEKYGRNPKVWSGHVDFFVKALSEPRYYRDPVVKHGYCRGSEPYNYVIQIIERFKQYQAQIHG